MGYEMTRPSQKWLGVIGIFGAFMMILFTLAVPYINHFGDDDSRYSYFTKWSGRWRSDNLPPNTFDNASGLYNFPMSAAWLIGLGLLIMVIGAGYLFWLTYSNKACYFTREKPGPIGGSILILGTLFYLMGSMIYESWAYTAPKPAAGWPGDDDFLAYTVRLSPTFWIGLVIALGIFSIGVMSLVYYLDSVDKRPVK
ncbi:MAG: hypothetical protein ACTSPK_13825 [Candidatus Heimdallarchaeota archaeon]